MKCYKISNKWMIVLSKGEKIVNQLTEFSKAKNIESGYFTAIGAVSSVELAHYNISKKKYKFKKIVIPLEIVNLTGNIAKMGKEIVIHSHIVVGTDKMYLFGGHLKEAIVSGTCEIILNELDLPIKRKYNETVGLNLIDV